MLAEALFHWTSPAERTFLSLPDLRQNVGLDFD
jgi:hypothetical protein